MGTITEKCPECGDTEEQVPDRATGWISCQECGVMYNEDKIEKYNGDIIDR
jgi:transcription initiation factor TFIIIB Brf1 subunit/transcription initiation factor TFIIB